MFLEMIRKIVEMPRNFNKFLGLFDKFLEHSKTFPDISMKFLEKNKKSRLFLKCVGNVSEMCRKCVGHVSEMCRKCVAHVSEMCRKCVGNVLNVNVNVTIIWSDPIENAI